MNRGYWILHGLGWGAVFLLLAPVLQTFWISFSPDSFMTPPITDWSIRWYRVFLNDPRWVAATFRSVCVALLAATGSVLAAIPVAIDLHGASPRRQRWMVPLLMLPAVFPPAALGTGLLPLMHFSHLWGSMTSMVLIHTTVGVPIALLIIRTHFTSELLEMEAAAKGLGATPFQVLTRVTFQLTFLGVVAAWISVFVLSLNESLVSLFLATPDNETLPAVIWPQLRYAANPLVAVASCVTTAIGIAGAVAIYRLLRRAL